MNALAQSRPPVVRRIAPFAGACCLAWAAVPIGSSIDWVEYWSSLALAIVAGGVALGALRHRRLAWVATVPSALLLLSAIGLLRDAGGGLPSGASAVAILPVFQVALYSRSRRDLVIILAALAAFFVVPIWVVGGAGYPRTQYRAVALAVTADAIIGLTTQALVARVRRGARQSRAREQTLQRVTAAVDDLFDSSRPRHDVCEAVLRIGDATSAALYEPAHGGDQLVCTASAGIASAGDGVLVPRESPVYAALHSDRPRLLTGDVRAQVALTDVWVARGRPRSLLYQPLRRGERRLGVLVVGWADEVRLGGAETATVALLGHEAAAVISRADAIDELNEKTLTDELTGLPNRRAWNLHLGRQLTREQRLTVVILDLDHFKRYNDTHGHAAGDRLLKGTAAAWRAQLRAGDVLARIGGEEFGLLLGDRDTHTALEIVDRLRRHVTHGQTCSAGVAVQRHGEPPLATVERADAALYRAKGRGRDQIVLTDRGSPAVGEDDGREAASPSSRAPRPGVGDPGLEPGTSSSSERRTH
jgi:diguanylate cyclase (GGDEF)-like protein